MWVEGGAWGGPGAGAGASLGAWESTLFPDMHPTPQASQGPFPRHAPNSAYMYPIPHTCKQPFPKHALIPHIRPGINEICNSIFAIHLPIELPIVLPIVIAYGMRNWVHVCGVGCMSGERSLACLVHVWEQDAFPSSQAGPGPGTKPCPAWDPAAGAAWVVGNRRGQWDPIWILGQRQ